MHVIRLDGHDERLAVASICLDTAVVSQIAGSLDQDAFPSKWANIVTSWAIDHYRKYSQAPGPAGLTARFADWARSADENTKTIVERWLNSLEPSQGMAPDYAVDLIRKICMRTSVHRHTERLQGALDNGKIEEAVSLAEAYGRPTVGEQLEGTFPLQDTQALEHAFDYTQAEPIIRYDNALGEFLGPMMSRDSFVAIMGSAKRGKSSWLIEFAWRAVMQNRKVVYLSIGDMSEPQFLTRLMPKAAKIPRSIGTFKIPTDIRYEEKEPILTTKNHVVTKPLTKEQGIQAIQAIGGNDPQRFRVVTRPAGTISAIDIQNMAERWADAGWVPDVIVIDYADILAGSPGLKETRDKINDNWIRLRAMSTSLHCLVLTATQADTEGYDTWLLGQRNFNGDRRINDHVTGIIGINQTPYEKRLGITRLNWVTLREAEFMEQNPSTILACAGNMSVGRPAILTKWLET